VTNTNQSVRRRCRNDADQRVCFVSPARHNTLCSCVRVCISASNTASGSSRAYTKAKHRTSCDIRSASVIPVRQRQVFALWRRTCSRNAYVTEVAEDSAQSQHLPEDRSCELMSKAVFIIRQVHSRKARLHSAVQRW
jgi:hypothetical protein